MVEMMSNDNPYQYFLLSRNQSYRLFFSCSQKGSILLHQELLPIELVIAASVLFKKI